MVSTIGKRDILYVAFLDSRSAVLPVTGTPNGPEHPFAAHCVVGMRVPLPRRKWSTFGFYLPLNIRSISFIMSYSE